MAANANLTSEIGSQYNEYLLAPDFLQQLAGLHLPDCPDKYQLLDQCSHCYRRQPANNTTNPPHQAPYQAAVHGQKQEHRNAARLYAEVVSTPTPLYVPPTTVTTFDMTSQWTYNPNFYHAPMIPTTQPTWAEVASDPSQVVTPQYPVHLPSDSSIPESQAHMHGDSQYTAPRPQPSTSRAGPIRNPRIRQSNPGYLQAPANRGMRLVQTSNRRVPLLIDDHFVSPGPSSHPRDVNSLVQSTHWGGHRQSTPQTDAPIPPALMPPGPPSVASSSKSKASSRRKGHQLRDPKYPHECQECHNRFAKSDDLRRHVDRTHSNIADRPHRCPAENCTWAFVNPKDLNRHFQTHSTTRPRFACNYYACEKSYSRPDNLQRHIDRDHNVDSAYMSQSMSRQTSSNTNYSQPIFE